MAKFARRVALESTKLVISLDPVGWGAKGKVRRVRVKQTYIEHPRGSKGSAVAMVGGCKAGGWHGSIHATSPRRELVRLSGWG